MFYDDVSVLYIKENPQMTLVKISWGIFSAELFSTMTVEYVHCDKISSEMGMGQRI
jgi:hypothetical protein